MNLRHRLAWSRFSVLALLLLAPGRPLQASASCSDALAQVATGSHISFGFEVEYVPGEHPQLWDLYRPVDMDEAQWLSLSTDQRDAYVKTHRETLAPTKRTPSKMIRTSSAPAHLPDALIVDDTGNWEVVGGISGSTEELKRQTRILEAKAGAGSYQAHVVNSRMGDLSLGAAGYTLFSADLLAFRKLDSQLSRHEKDPAQVPGAFLLHPFLSVFTHTKKEMLLAVTEANLRGESWETVLPHFKQKYPHLHEAWAENRPYYKYTLANTLRTDIYGNGPGKLQRWGFEVRGAHKSLKALFAEVEALQTFMRNGFDSFRPFVNLEVVRTDAFETHFPAKVVHMVRSSVPVVESDDPRPNYLMFLARPFEQYADLLGLGERESRALRANILAGRTRAYEALTSLAGRFEAGQVSKAEAKAQCLVIIARFARESGLLPVLENYHRAQTALTTRGASTSAVL